MSYDQWKTASPYDDDPDVLNEAQLFLDEMDGIVTIEFNGVTTTYPSTRASDPAIDRACTIIELLLAERD